MNTQEQLNITAFFDEADVVADCTETTSEGVIRKLVETVARNHKISDVPAITSAVLGREALASTVVSDGLAVPHARIEGIDRPYAAVATFRDGLKFGDCATPVRVVFLALIPKDEPTLYLRILRSLASRLDGADALDELASAAGACADSDVINFFSHDKARLPAFITASDIMEKDALTLRESDTLQTCVNAFISQGVTEIPVVNAGGRLVGVARADRILHICLPDYLLWTRDLTKIANFQPFADMLRNERTSSLAQLVVREFPQVAPDTPAVAVAGELTRCKATQCYVVEDDKLVGVVALTDFLNKIFRD